MTAPPPQVAAWCAENGWGEVGSVHVVTGGDVSNVLRLKMGGGQSLILEVKPGAPEDTFAGEA